MIRKLLVASSLLVVAGCASFQSPRLERRSLSIPACMPAKIRNELAHLSARWGAINIVSHHRPGARIAGTRYTSYHATCEAVDFHPAPGSYEAVRSYLDKNWDGGFGTYSGRMHHLHIDTGPKLRWHHRM